MTTPWKDRQIALALSGGGIRAMLFHLGVLKYLAERKSLESVSHISTVSGGSLLLGLILHNCKYRWPSSEQFISTVYPTLRKDLCTRSLQWGAVRQLLRPHNWRYILSRANLLSKALQKEWGVTANLSALANKPEWSINGTTAETGKRFRFKNDSLGDYLLGYASPGDFPLADAMAVSAAFPGGFGPLALDTKGFSWKKRPEWNATPESKQEIEIGYQNLHLYDGGVYDNLGLEPFFDAGRAHPKAGIDFIYVSDAGAPLSPGFPQYSLNPWRLKRVADIMLDQTRALRVRTFMSYLEKDRTRGHYAYIGIPAAAENCLNGQQPANFPTTLRRVTTSEFDGVAHHGFIVAGIF